MAENQPATPPNDPAGTGGGDPQDTPPAATQEPPKDESGATKDGEKTITLKESDYKNLISQRDKNANEASANSEFVLTLAKEREIDSFLEQNKEKFPDVQRKDLMYLDDPEMLEEAAGQMQARLDDHAQAKLKDVQTTTAPILSPEERTAQLKKLKSSDDPQAFEKMVELRSSAQYLKKFKFLKVSTSHGICFWC